jgi:hypothetical protein
MRRALCVFHSINHFAPISRFFEQHRFGGGYFSSRWISS